MKRIISLVLALMLMLTVVGCNKAEEGNKQNPEKTPENVTQQQASVYADATEVLTKVWESYEADKTFMAMGGDMNNVVDNAPGKYDYTDVEALNSVFVFPMSQKDNITDAASLMHGMLQNNFAAAAYKLKDKETVNAFAADFKAGIDSMQWMCGFPERFAVISQDEYVITLYGTKDNVDYFVKKALEVLQGSQVLVQEDIVL